GNLSVSGTSNLAANVTTTGTQTYSGAVTLEDDISLVADDDITFASTIDGTQALTINAGTGDVVFNNEVGKTAALTNVQVTGNGITLHDNVTADHILLNSAELVFSDGVTLDASRLNNGTVQLFTDDFTAQGELDILAGSGTGGTITFGAQDESEQLYVCMDVAAGCASAPGAAAVLRLTPDISMSANEIHIGSQTNGLEHEGDITLFDLNNTFGDLSVTTAGVGNIQILDGYTGVGDLTLNTEATGEIQINNGNITVVDQLTFNGAVVLQSDTVLTSEQGSIEFNGTVDGNQSLTLSAEFGDIDMNAALGSNVQLANLIIEDAIDSSFEEISVTNDFTQVSGSGTTILNDAIEATNISFTVNSLTLMDEVELNTSENNGNITLYVDNLLLIDGSSTIDAGGGEVSLAPFTDTHTVHICSGTSCDNPPDDIHTTYDLGDLSISAGRISFGNNDHQGEITLEGITFDYELRVLNDNDIIVTGDLDGTNGGALVLNPGSGIAILEGGSIRTELDQTYRSNVQLSDDFELETLVGDIYFNGSLSSIGQDVDLTIIQANDVFLGGTVDLTGNFELENASGTLTMIQGLELTAANIGLNAQTIEFENGAPITLNTIDNGNIDLITDDLTIGGGLEMNAGTGTITLAPQNTTAHLQLCSGASCAAADVPGVGIALYDIGVGFSFNPEANFQVGQANHTGDITLYGFAANFDLTLANTGGGKIMVEGAYSSDYDLSLSSGSGGIFVNDAITLNGGNIAMTAEAGGNINLSANISTGNGEQVYHSAVELQGDVELTTGNADIQFNDTVDGAHSLDVNTNNGTVVFTDVVGGTTELAGLDVAATTIDFTDMFIDGNLSLSAANNLVYLAGTELDASGDLTLAVNQAGNTAGVTFDLNGLTLSSDNILLQGSGFDRLQGYHDVSNLWQLTGSTQGNIDSNHLTSSAAFQGFNQVLGGDTGDQFDISGSYGGSLLGGDGNDVIRQIGNGQIAGLINGGNGSNTYDVTATNNPVVIVWGSDFTNIQTLIGDGDTLQGNASGSTQWDLNGADSGTLNPASQNISFTGIDRLVSGSGGSNTFVSNGQYGGVIDLRGNDNNWHFTAGQRLTQGQVVGNGTLFIAHRDDLSAGNMRISNDDLHLPVLTAFTGNLYIGGKITPGNLPLNGGFNSIDINADRLTVTNAVQTGGNLVFLASDIELTGSNITSGGSVSFVSVGSFCDVCTGLTGSGDLIVNQETLVQAESGQVIAAGGVVQSDNLVLDFDGGNFELAVSQEQQETSQPSELSNARGVSLSANTSAFIERLGLDVVSVAVNFSNPAAAVLGVRAIEVIDLALFEEDLTLFGRLGEGVALAFAQCEEIEGCTPDVTTEELTASIDELQERIEQLERELDVTNDPIRREQIETLLAGFRSQQAEFLAYRNDLQDFTGFEELFDEEFGAENEIDMAALERELAVIETIYTRVRFLENLQFNAERRAQFAESTGLDLSEQRLNEIIESTLQAAARAEARVERLLDGE
ncbi:MAG: hypothetical protein JXQ97_12640, partial [Natronospirillum sp.]